MMQVNQAKITSNTCIGKDVYEMVLETSIAHDVSCGQFVQVEVPGFYLRRPISVSEVLDDNHLVLVYKTVGEGTAVLSAMKKDDTVSVFGPLGTGFPVENKDVVLIGGGVGVPPLVETAKQYIRNGNKVTAVLGFNTDKDAILVEKLKDIGAEVVVATMDGSLGTKGTVMDAIKENGIDVSFVLACGPLPMLKAVASTYTDGYISLESRMACGMGACMGCVVKDEKGEAKRVCKDGPVFEIGKVVL